MRVIAGSARGVRLQSLPGKDVRPTTDRIKETLFNVIGPFFDGGKVLDLFAGTGALGIEALSRGAEEAIFVERSRAVKHVRDNLKRAGFHRQAEVFHQDARRILPFLIKRALRFDLIFLDPPYLDPILLPILERIDRGKLLDKDGILVAEHSVKYVLPEKVGSLVVTRTLHFGDTIIDLYQHCAES